MSLDGLSTTAIAIFTVIAFVFSALWLVLPFMVWQVMANTANTEKALDETNKRLDEAVAQLKRIAASQPKAKPGQPFDLLSEVLSEKPRK